MIYFKLRTSSRFSKSLRISLSLGIVADSFCASIILSLFASIYVKLLLSVQSVSLFNTNLFHLSSSSVYMGFLSGLTHLLEP